MDVSSLWLSLTDFITLAGTVCLIVFIIKTNLSSKK